MLIFNNIYKKGGFCIPLFFCLLFAQTISEREEIPTPFDSEEFTVPLEVTGLTYVQDIENIEKN